MRGAEASQHGVLHRGLHLCRLCCFEALVGGAVFAVRATRGCRRVIKLLLLLPAAVLLLLLLLLLLQVSPMLWQACRLLLEGFRAATP
jgi:hypothetical protein